MNAVAAFKVAVAGLLANKLRSILTLLGVIIGVGAVIAVISIGSGSKAAIADQISSIGTNLIFVRPGAATTGGVRGAQGSGTSLTYQDAQALMQPGLVPAVALFAPEISTFGQLKAGGNNVNTRVAGVTPDYATVLNYKVAEGEFITDQDMQTRSLNLVLGANIAQTLFRESDAIGQIVLLNNRAFHVTGVLAPKGGTGQGLSDDWVAVALTTVTSKLQTRRTPGGGEPVNLITLQAASKDSVDEAKIQITSVLGDRHQSAPGSEDFTVTTQDDLIATRSSVTNVLTILLGSVAGISLIVGGIGIMNIMLVSVTERIHEIGIRKAVGAKRRDILAQFLIEATLLSFLGGGIGVAGGWGASRLLNHLSISGQQIQTLVSVDSIILALGVAIGIGLFFGIYPAVRASRLDPLAALRYQ